MSAYLVRSSDHRMIGDIELGGGCSAVDRGLAPPEEGQVRAPRKLFIIIRELEPSSRSRRQCARAFPWMCEALQQPGDIAARGEYFDILSPPHGDSDVIRGRHCWREGY